MNHSHFSRWLACLAVLLLLAACTVTVTPTSPTATPSPSPTLTPIVTPLPATPTASLPPTQTPAPTQTPTTTLTNTRPPLPTQTQPPTATPIPEPLWLVRAVNIPEWPIKRYRVWWQDNQTIKINIYDMYGLVNVSDDSISAFQVLETPMVLVDAGKYDYQYSPNETYLVKCTGKDSESFYHGLQLYRVSDWALIGQIDNIAHNCTWSINWTSDESLFAFAAIQNPSNNNRDTKIFVWKTDGTLPYVIGEGNPYEPGDWAWSPDLKQLIIARPDFQAFDPQNEFTFDILYIDQSPALKTGAGFINSHGFPRLSWLTNDIVSNHQQIFSTCTSTEYYVAQNGSPLPDISWESCDEVTYYDTQEPHLSPDQRWFMVDRTDQNFIDHRIPFDYTYLLFDLA